jgi:hypothetical protein
MSCRTCEEKKVKLMNAIQKRKYVIKRKKDILVVWSKLGRINSKCFLCGKEGGTSGAGLQAHHMFSKKMYPSLRYDIANRVIVCNSCHSFKGQTEYGSMHMSPMAVHKWIRERNSDYLYCITHMQEEIDLNDLHILGDIETAIRRGKPFFEFISK